MPAPPEGCDLGFCAVSLKRKRFCLNQSELTLQLNKMFNIVQIKDSLNPMNTGYKGFSLGSVNHIREGTVGEIQ